MRSFSSRSTTPNGELTCATTTVAAASGRAVALEERAVVEVEQLVAVHRENGAVLAPMAGGEAQSAAAAERLRLSDGDDLDASPAERCVELVFLSDRAGDDRTRDPGRREPLDRVRGERLPRHLHERLRLALRGLAEPLGLAAGEDERLHELTVGRAADRVVHEAGVPHRGGIQHVAAVDEERTAHAGRRVAPVELRQLGPLRHEHRRVGAVERLQRILVDRRLGQHALARRRRDPRRARRLPPR